MSAAQSSCGSSRRWISSSAVTRAAATAAKQPVEAGADDPLGPKVLEGLAEQQGGGVVLQCPVHQPIAQSLPLELPGKCASRPGQ